MSSAAGNEPQETFKDWVKEFRSMDKEIKDAGTTLGEMRKHRKELNNLILSWMQANKVPRVKIDDQVFERNIKSVQKAVTLDVIGDYCSEYFGGDEAQAAEFTAGLYASRTTEEKEVLTVVAASKKRPRLRPVDAYTA
jgi:hypothetical protein